MEEETIKEDGEGKGDEWEYHGVNVVRRHKSMRRNLFTPRRVRGAPPCKTLTPVRITEGCAASGQQFKRIDSWTARSTAHLAMGEAWTGTTTFMARTE